MREKLGNLSSWRASDLYLDSVEGHAGLTVQITP
jgi:hypothetical protein